MYLVGNLLVTSLLAITARECGVGPGKIVSSGSLSSTESGWSPGEASLEEFVAGTVGCIVIVLLRKMFGSSNIKPFLAYVGSTSNKSLQFLTGY